MDGRTDGRKGKCSAPVVVDLFSLSEFDGNGSRETLKKKTHIAFVLLFERNIRAMMKCFEREEGLARVVNIKAKIEMDELKASIFPSVFHLYCFFKHPPWLNMT